MLVKIKGLNPHKIKPNCKKLLQTDFESSISMQSEKKGALAEKAKSQFASPNLNWQTSFQSISFHLGNSEGRALPGWGAGLFLHNSFVLGNGKHRNQ